MNECVGAERSANIPNDLPIQLRPAESQDYPFILASWSNDAHKIKYESFIPNSIFFPRHKAFINKILFNSQIMVAHVEDERDLICGYLVTQPLGKVLLLHWAHVKPIYRRQGIFQVLLNNTLQNAHPDALLVVTSPFTLLPEFKRKYSLIFDPTHVDKFRANEYVVSVGSL